MCKEFIFSHIYICLESRSCPSSIGHPAVKFVHQIPSGLYFLFVTPCAGLITSLHYYAALSGVFTVQIWQVEGDMAIGPRSNTTVIVPGPGAHQTELIHPVSIKKGDMISVSASTTIPITAGFKDDSEIMGSEVNSVYHFDMTPDNFVADSSSRINLNDSSLKQMVLAFYVTVDSSDSQIEGKLYFNITHEYFVLLDKYLVLVFTLLV